MSTPESEAGVGSLPTLPSDEDMTPFMVMAYSVVHLSMLTLGLQIYLCFYSLSVYRAYPREVRKQRKPFLIISFIILALFTVSHIMDSWIFENWAIESPLTYAGYVAADVDKPHWGELLGTIVNILVNLVADALLIYRSFAIWKHHRFQLILVGLPSVVFLASVACGIAEISKSRDPKAIDLYMYLSSAWQGLSVLVTVLVTTSISYRLIKEQRRLVSILGRRTTDKYLGASALLIESALPYTLLGVITVILGTISSKKGNRASMSQAIAAQIIDALWYCSSALCPQVIIFRVTTGQSYTYDWEDSNISRHALSQNQFPPPEVKGNATGGPVTEITAESSPS